jgi:hypothetical protein
MRFHGVYFCTMAKRPTLFSGILGMKCPYCREGRFYVSHPYDLKHAGDTLEACPACRRSYSVEYGFYMGAMYLSYGMSVIVGFAAYLLTVWLVPGMAMGWRIAAVCTATLVMAPLVYAYSKVLYGNIFLPFKGPSDPGYRPVRRPDEWR